MSSNGAPVREEHKMLVLLYEFPAETRLTVYRRLDILNRSSIGWTWHPRTFINFVIAFVFLTKFYIMVTRIALLTLKISY